MRKRKMPVGIQTFDEIIQEDYVYVDKTNYVYELVSTGKCYFLGRPRRFGKSLFLSTLKAFFFGKRELFDGLAVATLETDWIEYPVFHLDLNAGDYAVNELDSILNVWLYELENKWGKNNIEDTLSTRFAGLIKRAGEQSGRKVVILIDEYDKPLISTLENEPLNAAVRNKLKAFYSVLKSSDQYLRFVFLTGVTKFSQVSVFSDLNQLRDISMEQRYASICGITETELTDNFQPELAALAAANNSSYEQTLFEMRKNFNGYHFSKNSAGVYNPFSVLNTFAKDDFMYYWFQTGTPTFLIKELQKNDADLRQFTEGAFMDEQNIADYRFGGNPVPLLYQTGYLTIKDYNKKTMRYTMTFPNEEVKYGFLKNLLPHYIPIAEKNGFFIENFLDDLEKDDIDGVMRRFQAFFSSIPYDIRTKFDAEQHYQTVFFLVFTLLAQYTQAEVRSEYGRADAVVKTDSAVYVIEFKLTSGGTVDDALKQIDDKGYLLPYTAEGLKLVKVGVVCDPDPQKRNIKEWKTVAASPRVSP
jgi:hypothetical protein